MQQAILQFYQVPENRQLWNRAPKDGDQLVSDNKGKPHLWNNQFRSVLTDYPPGDIPSPSNKGQEIPSIHMFGINEEGVKKILEELDSNKQRVLDLENYG